MVTDNDNVSAIESCRMNNVITQVDHHLSSFHLNFKNGSTLENLTQKIELNMKEYNYMFGFQLCQNSQAVVKIT